MSSERFTVSDDRRFSTMFGVVADTGVAFRNLTVAACTDGLQGVKWSPCKVGWKLTDRCVLTATIETQGVTIVEGERLTLRRRAALFDEAPLRTGKEEIALCVCDVVNVADGIITMGVHVAPHPNYLRRRLCV